MPHKEHTPPEPEYREDLAEEMSIGFSRQLYESAERIRTIAVNEWVEATPQERRIANLVATHQHPKDIAARTELFKDLALMRHFTRVAESYNKTLKQIRNLPETPFATPDNPHIPSS